LLTDLDAAAGERGREKRGPEKEREGRNGERVQASERDTFM
jgi:hypothetical protein